MENKCSKFENLFINSSLDELQMHIENCQECKEEAIVQARVSELIDEVKFYYKRKNKQNRIKITKICASFFIFFLLSAGLALCNEDLIDTLQYGYTLSAEDFGFPVDSYGLLLVNE